MQQNRNGNSINGFLLGVVVGALITLLFTTKKGRHILRTLTEEGLHKFTEVEDILHAMEEEQSGDDLGEYTPEEIRVVPDNSQEKMSSDVIQKTSHPLKRLTTGRKFFRKPPKK